MKALLSVLGLAVAAMHSVPSAAAAPDRMAISCTGEAIQDFKSLNLPAKTVPQTRIYVIDEAAQTVSVVDQGELTPVCDASKPACRAIFSAGGIRIDYRGDGESLKLVYNRAAATLGEQSENASLVTTFESRCVPADPATPVK